MGKAGSVYAQDAQLRGMVVELKSAGASTARLKSALKRAALAAQVAEDNRAYDIVVLDLRKLTSVFDFFVLATGNSRRQLHAISEEIDRVMEKELGDRRLGIEGYRESRWILLDYGDFVVHLFDEDTRSYYALEDLWGTAAPIDWRKEVDGDPS